MLCVFFFLTIIIYIFASMTFFYDKGQKNIFSGIKHRKYIFNISDKCFQ